MTSSHPEVTDRDTAADKVEVTATAKVTKFVTAISIGDPDDGQSDNSVTPLLPRICSGTLLDDCVVPGP